MLGVERQQILLDQLKKDGSIKIVDSAKKFNVSEETIRRDLNTIGRLLPIKKVYGGAYVKTHAECDAPLVFRQSFLKEEKDHMAAECLKLINNNDSIMIDSSDTAACMAKHLPELGYNLTVITNSMTVLEYLADCENIVTICTGGRLRHKAKSFVGGNALATINSHVADKAFISPSGVNIKFGPTDFNPDECQVRRKMLERSESHFLLADHTKLSIKDLKGVNVVCPINDIDILISDKDISPAWRNTLTNNQVEIILAEPSIQGV